MKWRKPERVLTQLLSHNMDLAAGGETAAGRRRVTYILLGPIVMAHQLGCARVHLALKYDFFLVALVSPQTLDPQ